MVNRKTTITTFPDVTFYDLVNSDSENSVNMVRRNKSRGKNRTRRNYAQTKSQNNAKSKVRKCDECHNIVPNGTDMYRFHRSRLTVCKNCWIRMDPSKDKSKLQSQQVESNLTETKLCAVFLTDVFDNKSEKEYKMEKNKDKAYISNDSSEDRLSGSVTPKKNDAVNNNTKQGKKRQINAEKKEDVESTPTKVTKLSKSHVNATEAKVSSDVEQQSTNSTRQRRTRAIVISSDSDISPLGLKDKSKGQTEILSPSSSKPGRKKLKTTLEGVSKNVHSESTDESSTEDSNSKRKRKASSTRANKEKNVRKRLRSDSISNTEMTPLSERFPSPKSPEVKKKYYTCDTCDKKFDTKLENAEHSLTHFLQASIKLERIIISSNIKEKQELKIDSEKDKISEEAKTVSTEKYTDNISNEINVEDTDEEMFTVTRKDSAEKEEANSESCNVTDKLDAENEVCVDESTKNQSDEKIMEESEQCVESTDDVPNETETFVEIKQDTEEKNKNIRERDTKGKNTENKNRKTSTDKDIDTLQCTGADIQNDIVAKETSSICKVNSSLLYNLDEEENKDVENGTKVSTKEKEKSNNDEEHPHEETHDNETTKSSVSSINNMTKDKIHSKSKNDLKNSEDNESEIVKDVEVEQCDPVNESREENINESEEKNKNVLNIVDETETLKDQIDLDDVVVDENKVIDETKTEASEKSQDPADEKNMETEVIINVDKSNSAKDIVKSDFLKNDKSVQMEDGDEDKSNDVIISAGSNDIVQCTKVTEEIITVAISKEKCTLEETMKKLEELIETDTTNNKCEDQENLNHSLNDSSTDAANMILKEVFDLAAAEVQKREDAGMKSLRNTESLENITREIRNSADMPSLDPIMDIDDDNDITLN